MNIAFLRSTPAWAAFTVPLNAAIHPSTSDWTTFAEHALTYFRESHQIKPEIFLLGRRIHIDGGADLLNAYTALWKPKVGVGLWPTRPAPRRRTPEDAMDEAADMLMSREPEKTVDVLLRLSGEQPVREQAALQMIGRGALTMTFSRFTFAEWEQQLRARWLPTIEDSSYRYERFYLPQFDRGNLEAATDEQLTDWMCGASVYVRESPNDQALLVLCEQRLADGLVSNG